MLTLTKSKILFRNKPLCSFIKKKTFHGTYFEGLVCFQGGGRGGRGGYYSLLNTVLEIIIIWSTIYYIILHYITLHYILYYIILHYITLLVVLPWQMHWHLHNKVTINDYYLTIPC